MHDTWRAWHEIDISEHDIHNVRVAWQCGSKAPQTQVSKWQGSASQLVGLGLAKCALTNCVLIAIVKVANLHEPQAHVGSRRVLIAYGEDWD